MAQYRMNEAANLLGVSDDTLRRWVAAGSLKAHKNASGRQVVEGAELAAWAKALAIVPADPTSVTRSARNRFVGLVTEIIEDKVMAQVEIQCGPHRVVSLMSSEAVRELRLEVIDGTDNFETRYLVADTCADLGIPLVWGSILRFDAQVSVFWSKPTDDRAAVHLRDLFPAAPAAGTVESCSTAGVLGALCGQVGSVMAAEAVKLITGAGDVLLGRVLVLDALNARWHEVPLRASPTRTLDSAPIPSPTQASPAVSATEALPASAPPTSAPPTTQWPPPRTAPDAPNRLTPAALGRRLTARDQADDEFVLVDVRDPHEFASGAIPGATSLPLAQVLTENGTSAISADETVVLYCGNNSRAAMAARELVARGFTTVEVLDGGYTAWVGAQHRV